MTYPKLRYPIHTKGLSNEDRLILLGYDMLWRVKNIISKVESELKYLDKVTTEDDDHDLDVNLSNLGHHIETMLCGGDMTLRFEGYDGMGKESMEQHFMDKVQRELFTEDAIDEAVENQPVMNGENIKFK